MKCAPFTLTEFLQVEHASAVKSAMIRSLMKQRRRSIGTRGKIKFDTAREQAIKWVARYIAGMGMDVSEVDGKQAFIALSDACKIAPETYAAAFSDEASERQYKFFIRDWEIYRRDHRRI